MCKIDELSEKEIIKLSKDHKSISDIFKHLAIESKHSTFYYKKWNARCKILGIDSKELFVKNEKIKRSKIDDQSIIKLCKEKISATDVFRAIGLSVTAGSNFRWINKKIKELDVNVLHWEEAKKENIQKAIRKNTIPLEEILVENSSYLSSHNLKNRLIKENLLEYKCYECGIFDWRGKNLSLQLEHKNGIPSDNRIENLELLCPNCHSQTKTFANKNAKKYDKHKEIKEYYENKCVTCNVSISNVSKMCKKCYTSSTKIKWPPNNVLLQMVQDTNFSQAAQKLGVSDNAIRKRLKKANLI